MKKIISACLFVFSFWNMTSCTKEDAKGFASPTGTGGSRARFTIVNHYLYTVDHTTLKVYDISYGPKPQLKSSIDVGFEIETIFPFKDKLFIGSTSVVHIFSIDDPAQPKKLSEAVSPEVLRRCDPVVAKDSVAYATLRTNGPCGGTESILAVYDIRNVLNPVQVNSQFLAEPYGLGYAENALYVCDLQSLVVFDISDPYSPVRVTQVSEEQCYDVIPYDNTLVCWTSTGLSLYDITDKFAPRLIVKIN